MADLTAIHSWRLPEGRCAGYASINLGAIAAAEQTRRLADVTVFEPTGDVSAVPPREADVAGRNIQGLRYDGVQNRNTLSSAALGVLSFLQSPRAALASWFKANASGQVPAAPQLPVAWHPRRQWLAAADSEDRVHVLDYEPPSRAVAGSEPAPPVPKALLQHVLQTQVAAVAWRPHGGGTLAVACADGICLWTLGRGVPMGTSVEASMVFLRSQGRGTVRCLAWSSSGQLLASTCSGNPGFSIWDVAQGVSIPLAAGLEQVTQMQWSPDGCYLLAGGSGSSLRVWETQRWRHSRWSWPAPAKLVSAAWSPNSKVLLLAFEEASQMAALHFLKSAPSLLAQLMPVHLPRLGQSPPDEECAKVWTVAWDANASRLAVCLSGSSSQGPAVALFATALEPLLTASFLGFIRDGSENSKSSCDQEGQDAAGPSSDSVSGSLVKVDIRAAGEKGRHEISVVRKTEGADAALSFQPSFERGSLLAVQRGDSIRVLPLYYSA